MKTYSSEDLFNKFINKSEDISLSAEIVNYTGNVIVGNKYDSTINCYFYGDTLTIQYHTHPYIRSTSVSFYIDKDTDNEKVVTINFAQTASPRTYTFNNLSNTVHKFEVINNDTSNFYWSIISLSVNDDSEIFKDIFLLEDNSKYYSINEDNYDSTIKSYKEVNISDLETKGFSINRLAIEITIDDETFKPIDKFSDSLTFHCNNKNRIIVKGLKTNIRLLIARESFSTRLAKNIDFFELISNISDNSSIKMVVSVDTGTTWKVWDKASSTFVDLTNRPPLKKYEELSEEELLQWNTFRDEVNEKGIDSKTLKSIDFNSIKSDDMMFAYTFNRNSYEDKCEMSKLQYQFDAYGSYTLLNSDSTVAVKQSTDVINITPKKDMDLMKVNIGSSGEVTINNINIDIDNLSNEQLQKLKEKLNALS